MQLGDLVEITSRAGVLHAGKVGVITDICGPSMTMSYIIMAVTFPNGSKLAGITHRWVKVLNANR
jgi:hypothetical protein